MTTGLFSPGISALIGPMARLVEGKKIGLVSHNAAIACDGASSLQTLLRMKGTKVAAIFGPEHGYFGAAAAGERVAAFRHPGSNAPVYSLYGENRKPTPRMLRNIDAIVFDLQDIGARCYTYVSTLRLAMEAAAEQGKTVIVADRPIPLPRVVDGPVLDPAFESFVGCVPAPLAYGMTPGETAMWLKKTLGLAVELHVCKMRNYFRDRARRSDWPPWIPPSPGIASWESGYCYTATVFFEALPSVDHGRGGVLPFQVFGSPWIRGAEVCERLNDMRLPGVKFHQHRYMARSQNLSGVLLDGGRMTVADPNVFKPVTTAVSLIACLQKLYGEKRLWRAPGARPEFFDKLFGSDEVRLALMDSESPETIAKRWKRRQAAFATARRNCLLYAAN